RTKGTQRAIVGAAALAIAALSRGAGAANLYWDVNGASTGGSNTTTAAGTWSGTTTFWSTDSAGLAATGIWTTGSTAVFSAGGGVTGSYTVTVAGTQSAAGITFEEGTLNLSGGAIDFDGGTGAVIV